MAIAPNVPNPKYADLTGVGIAALVLVSILLITRFAKGFVANIAMLLGIVIGGVVAWGSNTYGQCNVPTNLTSNVMAVAGGGFFSLALKTNGAVEVFGIEATNEYAFGIRDVPAAALSNVAAIAASGGTLSMTAPGYVLVQYATHEIMTAMTFMAVPDVLRSCSSRQNSTIR